MLASAAFRNPCGQIRATKSIRSQARLPCLETMAMVQDSRKSRANGLAAN
jgi:hypothetical protein